MIVTDMGDIALQSQLEIYIGDKEKTHKRGRKTFIYGGKRLMSSK